MSGVVLTCYRHVIALGKPRTQLPNFYRTIPCLHYNVSTVFPVLLNIFLPLNDVEQAMHNSVYFAPNTVFLVLRSVAGSDRGVACFFRSLRGVPPIAGILGPTPNTQSVEEFPIPPPPTPLDS